MLSLTPHEPCVCQVAGYATRYEPNNFTFITVKGGRHEVPETAPWQALEMLRRLLSGENF